MNGPPKAKGRQLEQQPCPQLTPLRSGTAACAGGAAAPSLAAGFSALCPQPSLAPSLLSLQVQKLTTSGSTSRQTVSDLFHLCLAARVAGDQTQKLARDDRINLTAINPSGKLDEKKERHP
ncbi:hypothetical protein Y1Q_0002310 [Alligator mississippiensis]|uniref:Uncharacterized protein n=1 Tax=Alligator mississippiensis TaxID=8496 RepID=A0A151MGR2_ALLMI|nr:hypothetical protein Y1Q_0002310 [Alligator mississippiensis]